MVDQSKPKAYAPDMKIIYKTGDLMQATEPFILHGCNALGKMGKGVALLIKERYPVVFERYEAEFLEHGLHLGQVIWVETDGHTILNAITQQGARKHYDPDGVVYVDYENGVRKSIRSINASFIETEFPDAAVALPLIGAGLAGGHWPTIAAIIEEESTAFQPVVYLYDGKIPT